MIVTLELAPGAVVSEAELSKKLGIGRTPIGEAVQRLAREDLITILPRRGIVVAEINIKKQLKLLEVRREVEASQCARCAAAPRLARGSQAARKSPKPWTHHPRRGRRWASCVSITTSTSCAPPPRATSTPPASWRWCIPCRAASGSCITSRPRTWPKASSRMPICARAIASGDAKAAGEASDRLLDYIEEFTRASLTDFL